MIGDTFQTAHFGRYVEMKDTSLVAGEFVGNVVVKELNGYKAAFLYVNLSESDYVRYDLPEFMLHYDGRRVAILGRPYDKQVNDKVYHKLVVISAKTIPHAA